MSQRIRSECGRYLAERQTGDDWRYMIYDAEGQPLGLSSYWSNRGTDSRIAFETGFGDIKATFGYPRYPRWFRRRWALCFDLWIDDLAALVEGFGAEILQGFKPDMNCWSHVGFRATSEQLKRIDGELDRRGVRWNGPPCKPGQWDIECPTKARDRQRFTNRSPTGG